MKAKQYPGFGVEKSVTGWARFLGLPYATVWRQLNDGATPEEIATEKGLTLDMGLLNELTERDKRRLAEIKERMEDILDASDYDPDGVEIHPKDEKGKQCITWNGLTIGVYDYQKDALSLTDGDCLKIRHPIVPSPKIVRNEDGRWAVHPETKKAILDKRLR